MAGAALAPSPLGRTRTRLLGVQFRSRVAFKLVWVPPSFGRFVLVDDEGAALATGAPSGALPARAERQRNFELVRGSKYAREAEQLGSAHE